MRKIDGKATPEYRSWMGMRGRCYNPGNTKWERYGGRGIEVCERWNSFENFLADMGLRPPGTSIDRINNDGDYEPGNCRWATHSVQARNRSATSATSGWSRGGGQIVVNGVSKTATQWARQVGINPKTIMRRITSGWAPEVAISKPPVSSTKLSRAEAEAIRAEPRRPGLIDEPVSRYGIGRTQIGKIRAGKSWVKDERPTQAKTRACAD
jgi:hypothetical protein